MRDIDNIQLETWRRFTWGLFQKWFCKSYVSGWGRCRGQFVLFWSPSACKFKNLLVFLAIMWRLDHNISSQECWLEICSIVLEVLPRAPSTRCLQIRVIKSTHFQLVQSLILIFEEKGVFICLIFHFRCDKMFTEFLTNPCSVAISEFLFPGQADFQKTNYIFWAFSLCCA